MSNMPNRNKMLYRSLFQMIGLIFINLNPLSSPFWSVLFRKHIHIFRIIRTTITANSTSRGITYWNSDIAIFRWNMCTACRIVITVICRFPPTFLICAFYQGNCICSIYRVSCGLCADWVRTLACRQYVA